MAENFSFISMMNEINETEEQGLSFANKAAKWNNAEDVEEVVNALERQKVVNYLVLDGNTLGVPAAEAIGKALERHPEFRRAIWMNMFTSRLKEEIPAALEHLGNGLIRASAQLTVLDLSDNALGPNGMKGLETFLRSPVCYSLQELRLNNCGLGIYGARMLAEAMKDCLNASVMANKPLKLKTFIAGRNRMENEGAQAMADMLSALKTLEEISMPQNSIFFKGIEKLCLAVQKNPNLKVLNLNDNIVSSKGAQFVARALAFTPYLRELNLGDCLLQTNGAYQMAEILEDSLEDLEVLDLSHNEINSDGGLALVTALLNKTELRDVNLDGNMFGAVGAEAIINVAQNFRNDSVLRPMEENESSGDEDERDEEDDNDDDDDEDDSQCENDEQEEYVDEDEQINGEEKHVENTDEDEAEYKDVEETANQLYTTAADVTNVADASTASKIHIIPSYPDLTDKTSIVSTDFILSRKTVPLNLFNTLPHEDKLASFNRVMTFFTPEAYVQLLAHAALKCAHLSRVSNDALVLATLLLQQCFDYLFDTNQEQRYLTFFMIHLKLKPLPRNATPPNIYDEESCRYAFKEALQTQNFRSELIRKTLTDALA